MLSRSKTISRFALSGHLFVQTYKTKLNWWADLKLIFLVLALSGLNTWYQGLQYQRMLSLTKLGSEKESHGEIFQHRKSFFADSAWGACWVYIQRDAKEQNNRLSAAFSRKDDTERPSGAAPSPASRRLPPGVEKQFLLLFTSKDGGLPWLFYFEDTFLVVLSNSWLLKVFVDSLTTISEPFPF